MARRWELREASSERLREKEDSILYAAGYRPTEGGLWRRSEMLFGRGAALQYALKELRDKGELNLFEQQTSPTTTQHMGGATVGRKLGC